MLNVVAIAVGATCATGSEVEASGARVVVLADPAGAREPRACHGHRTNRVVVRSLAEFRLALDAALAVAIVMVLR